MLNRMRLLVLGSLFATTLAGCASASATGPANVTGTWTGGSVGEFRNVTMNLQQTGANVTGTVTGAGAADGPIHGVIGPDGTIQLSAERRAFAPRLAVRGDVMNGAINGIPMKLIRFGALTQMSP